MFGTSAVAGPSEDVVGASVPSFAPGKLPATLSNVVGDFVPSGPLILVLIGPVTGSPEPSGFLLKIGFPLSSFLPVGYTRSPFSSVYTTGAAALLATA